QHRWNLADVIVVTWRATYQEIVQRGLRPTHPLIKIWKEETKRKFPEMEPTPQLPDKRNKIDENSASQEPQMRGSTMYIPLSELTQELDVLRKVAELEIT
ncbi:932_t:CDS:2, partial [Racocetra persica]